MNIIRRVENDALVLELSGKLYTPTASLLQKEILTSLKGTKNIVLDFRNVEFLASSGLMALLAAQKAVSQAEGKMVIKNVNYSVMNVLTITGFASFLTIEQE